MAPAIDIMPRVTIGSLLRDVFSGEPSAGRWLVLDHHRLADDLRKLGADQAGENIVTAAGRETDDHADRPARIVGLGKRRHDGRGRRPERGKRGQDRPAGEMTDAHETSSKWFATFFAPRS
jgi:hypothetical protein